MSKKTTIKKKHNSIAASQKSNRGEKSKALIQEALIYFVSDEGLGLSEITLDKICKKSKLTTGAFYFHFKNKDEAIKETAIDKLYGLKRRIDAIKPAEDLYSELRQIILLYIKMFKDQPKVSRLVYVALRSLPEVHDAYVVIHKSIAHRLEKLFLRERKATGLTTKDSYLMVEFLLSGIESFIENCFSWKDDEIRKAAGEPEELSHKIASMWCNAAGSKMVNLSDK